MSSVTKPSPLHRRLWAGRKAYLFLLPTFALLFTFSYYPAFSALFRAFQTWQPNGDSQWVGIDNFAELYHETFSPGEGVGDSDWTWLQLVGIGIPIAVVLGSVLCARQQCAGLHWRRSAAMVALLMIWSRQILLPGNTDFTRWQIAISAGLIVQLIQWRKHRVIPSTGFFASVVLSVALFLRYSTGGDFRLACSNLVSMMLFQLSVGLIMPAVIADILFNLRSSSACYAYRVLFTLPLVVPGIVTTLMWMFIYDFNAGALNQLLELSCTPVAQTIVLACLWYLAMHLAVICLLHRMRAGRSSKVAIGVVAALLLAPCVLVGMYLVPMDGAAKIGFCEYTSSSLHLQALWNCLPLQPRNWLGDSKTALGSIMLMGVPWASAIPMLLFFAALQGIPASVLESAKLDGATGIRRILHIELPMILGQFKVLLVLGIINGIQGFQTVLIMTFGGPGKSTELPGLIMFKEAFSYGRLGYGTAIGVVMFIVIMLLTVAGMRTLGNAGDEN